MNLGSHIPAIDGAAVLMAFLLATVAWPAHGEELGPFEGHADIGEVGHLGSVKFDAAKKTFTITASGADMWARADQFHYLYKKAKGDATITADIRWLGDSSGSPNRKACLVIRQNLEPGSAYVDAAAHGDGHLALQWRPTDGGETADVVLNVAHSPKTVRIEKRGDEFRMYAAAEGEKLQTDGEPYRLNLTEPFYIGLAVCSHDDSRTEAVEFSNVVIDEK